VAADVRALADAQGWRAFAVAGASGGGPHALACAAELPDRVTRCAVSASISPPITTGPRPVANEPDPRRNLTSWLAAQGESHLRPHVQAAAVDIMATIEAGGPEVLRDPHMPDSPATPITPALQSPASMARLRATFVDSHDGWVDDNLAFARPWGFAPHDIAVPVSIWFGNHDTSSRQDAAWLQAEIRTAHCHEYEGGHLQSDVAYRSMLAWLR
jgi:pimeloyl-ACP methyl ester carboxylesterase